MPGKSLKQSRPFGQRSSGVTEIPRMLPLSATSAPYFFNASATAFSSFVQFGRDRKRRLQPQPLAHGTAGLCSCCPTARQNAWPDRCKFRSAIVSPSCATHAPPCRARPRRSAPARKTSGNPPRRRRSRRSSLSAMQFVFKLNFAPLDAASSSAPPAFSHVSQMNPLPGCHHDGMPVAAVVVGLPLLQCLRRAVHHQPQRPCSRSAGSAESDKDRNGLVPPSKSESSG